MSSLQLEKRLNVLQWVVVILLVVVIAVPGLVTWWISRNLPVVDVVKIENLQIVGKTELCKGDPLIVEYDFHAKGKGVLVRDFTLWDIEPPRTLIFSMSRRFILDGPIDQHLREAWHIPDTYLNYETEEMEPLAPGAYRRFLAISSPSRSTVIDIASVDFVLRDDC